MPPVKVSHVSQQADLAMVRTLFAEYADSIGFSLCFQDFDRECAELPGRYAPPSGRLLLAYVGDVCAGCVALRSLGERRCEMKRLYVRPQYQSQGVGRHLATTIIDEGRAAGYIAMRLDTVPAMQKAISLYQSLGFRDIEPYVENPIEGARYLELTMSNNVESANEGRI